MKLMSKEFLNIFGFLASIVFFGLYMLYNDKLYFGFMLLFSVMFIVDSFWYMLKKTILKDKFAPIGGDLK